ncbi:MAG: hypothetical protein MZV70_69125 [Desulfobacterales bacterium]|nr:hypothetical protein [Desulfobacterales bacterium]
MKKAPEDVVNRLTAIAGQIKDQTKASVLSPSRTKLMSAHALVSLAKIAPDRAGGILPDFLHAPDWVVRTYAGLGRYGS